MTPKQRDEEVEKLLEKYGSKAIILIECTVDREAFMSAKFHPLMRDMIPTILRRKADDYERRAERNRQLCADCK